MIHDKDLNRDHSGQFHGVASILCFRLTEGNKHKNQRFDVV